MASRSTVGAQDLRDPGFAAFTLLRVGFTVAPILFGLDKFFNLMVDWEKYLWQGVADTLPGTDTQIMMAVGVVEILAGLAVAVAPRIGGVLVAFWLGTIITNLVIVGVTEGEYWDIALRDFGLMLGAIALVILSLRYGPIARRGSSGEGSRREGGHEPARAPTGPWQQGGEQPAQRPTGPWQQQR